MKVGDKVKLVKRHGLSGYSFYPRLKKFKTLTIDHIKPSGGLLFRELTIGYTEDGEEQGIYSFRFKLVRKRKPSPVQIINKELLRILSKKKK